MTPCEQKGYKVGDWFEVLPEAQMVYSSVWGGGEQVRLKADDGTNYPKFVDDKGEDDFLSLDIVKSLAVEGEFEEVLPLIEDSEGNLYVEMTAQQPETPLVDKLEQALATLITAQEEADRLQAEFKEAYPLTNREAQPTEDMNDPANWKEGDVVECIDSEATGEPDYFTEGKQYQLFKKGDSTSYKYVDDEGDDMWAHNKAFHFVRRPKK